MRKQKCSCRRKVWVRLGWGMGEGSKNTSCVTHQMSPNITTVQSNPTTTHYVHTNNILIIELFLDEDLHINRLVRYISTQQDTEYC